MTTNTYRLILAALALAGSVAIGVYAPHVSFPLRAAECSYAHAGNPSATTDCWFLLLEKRLKDEGIEGVIHDFKHLRETYPSVVDAGACHRGAHRIGDMLYYKVYLNTPNLDALNFPPESVFCTFGLFHGFFEHLFQDRPDPSFVADTCAYIERRFSASVGNVRHQCYHGAGHGFMLAYAERVPRSAWGSPEAFVQKPLEECGRLTEATEQEKQQCRQGVFTVLTDWSYTGQYGLRVDAANPFGFCARLRNEAERMCYNQVADRWYGEKRLNIPLLARDVEGITDAALQAEAFSIGVLGYVQSLPRQSVAEHLVECRYAPAGLTDVCIAAFPWALFNSGFPEVQHREALALCTSAEVVREGAQKTCFVSQQQQLFRFFSSNAAKEKCKDIPAAHQNRLCAEALSSAGVNSEKPVNSPFPELRLACADSSMDNRESGDVIRCFFPQGVWAAFFPLPSAIRP